MSKVRSKVARPIAADDIPDISRFSLASKARLRHLMAPRLRQCSSCVFASVALALFTGLALTAPMITNLPAPNSPQNLAATLAIIASLVIASSVTVYFWHHFLAAQSSNRRANSRPNPHHRPARKNGALRSQNRHHYRHQR